MATGLRSPWNVDSGSASAPTVAEAEMADEPAVVAGAGITEECVDAVTQARAMLIRHEAAEIVEAAGMRETLTSRQGCHAWGSSAGRWRAVTAADLRGLRACVPR